MIRTLRCVDRPALAAIVLLLNVGFGAALAAGPDGARSPYQGGSAGTGSPTAGAAAAADPIRGRIERLSMLEAKQFYLDCSRSAMRGRLDGASTALCSIGYDVLLKRHFGGDFHALLAWSRSQADGSEAAVGIGGD